MNQVEDLIIYKQYVELIYYTESIVKKYPKSERYALATMIKNTTYEGLKYIIHSYRAFDKPKKLENLILLDVQLKVLKVLIRNSYKQKYISVKNYTAWSKKITNIGNLLGGWIRSCQKL